MAVVALIPTGSLEHAALDDSLAQLFPEHDFVVRPREKHLNGFTSRNVAPLLNSPAGPVPSDLYELAAELVNAILPGRREEKIDFAFAVDDLELVNDSQPELVLKIFRNAVDQFVQELWPQNSTPIYNQVQDRCSFHLLRPMTEAYFFGEPGALTRAGSQRKPLLPNHLDLEEFSTADPEFEALPAGNALIADMPLRQRHPKAYLHFLCDPTLADKKRKYRETHGGVAALRSLDWRQVVSVAPHCPFIHAFLDDVAEALDHPLPFLNQASADSRSRFPGPRDRVLRNL
ncbi:MAG: hypothetical protein RIC55_36455 [Pirellulaceae bacterium]